MAVANKIATADVDETTPLIVAEGGGVQGAVGAEYNIDQNRIQDHGTVNGHAEGDAGKDVDDEIPWIQVLVLCYARMVEPIAFFSILPFIGQMINNTGSVPEKDVGFYAGIIEGLFSVTQMFLMLFWGWLSDRIGRKPVLVLSELGMTFGIAAFGFSRNMWQMVVFRCAAGFFAGSLVTIRTMLSENSTPRTQAKTFSYLAVAGNLGISFGPFIGGILSEPVKNFPGIFGNSELFRQYPYGLAGLLTAFFSLSSSGLCAIFLKETLKRGEHGETIKPMSTGQLLRSPGVSIVLFVSLYTGAVAMAYTAVMPVYYWQKVKDGGDGLTNFQISMCIGLVGFTQAFYSLLLFPRWQTRYGTGNVMKVLYFIYPFFMALNPVPSMLRRTGHETAFWITRIGITVTGPVIALVFTANQLALNDVAPTSNTLGMLNAISLSFSSGIRAIAPPLATALYAIGVKKQILGGYLIWAIFTVLVLVLPIASRWIPERAAGFGPVKKAASEEEDEEET